MAPATVDASLRDSIFESRTQALQSIHGAELPEVLSPLAEHLLLLMEGIYKDTPEVGKKLNAAALKAFSPISRALAGDGVVSATHIRNMGSSLDDLDLTLIERRLFEVMLLTLTMNGHLQAYNIGMAKSDDAGELDELLTNAALRCVSSSPTPCSWWSTTSVLPTLYRGIKRTTHFPRGPPRSCCVVRSERR